METQKLGDLIARKRCKKAMTQQDLALGLHVSPAAVSKWERGVNTPDLEKLKALSVLLDISSGELLEGMGFASEQAEDKEQSTEGQQASKAEEKDWDGLPGPEAIDSSQNKNTKLSLKENRKEKRTLIFMLAAAALAVAASVSAAVYLHGKNQALELAVSYNGDYKGEYVLYFNVEGDKKVDRSVREEYAKRTREEYSHCFGEVDALVIVYYDEYDTEKNPFSNARYITVLYPRPSYEGMSEISFKAVMGEGEQESLYAAHMDLAYSAGDSHWHNDTDMYVSKTIVYDGEMIPAQTMVWEEIIEDRIYSGVLHLTEVDYTLADPERRETEATYEGALCPQE